ncbi:immunity 49 family protein [Mycolicibacterium sp. 050232]|uniref:immunity 49 family protein n=1 Tax=Mycolicibacterium sp. 050232 TaxID=3113982 RepID=UPI002E28ACC4|nr:immunity 49 family protein [Mycolicibacterium sp. 050232]MED5816356.1 immunity 49 family protein [Mycolicibacterium sp. 050232]
MARHELGTPLAEIGRLATDAEQAVRSLYDLITSSPGNVLSRVAIGAETSARFQFGLDPSGATLETRLAARRAAQLIHASFQLAALPPGESLVIEVDSGGLETCGTGPEPDGVNVRTWLTAYWWARATRNATMLDTLAGFDADTLTPGTRFDRATLGLVEILQARDRGDDSWARKISETVPFVDQPTTSSREEALFLQLDLFGVLASIGDQDTFTDQLEIALNSHRTYWSKNEERREHPQGFASLPLLGLASMAADEGMRIEVESDYLPRELITNWPWMFELP